MSTRTDQPEGVQTDEVVKPGDEHVVTSDLPSEAEATPGADDAAAAGASSGDAPDGQNSAAGDSQDDGNHEQRHGNSRWQRQQRRLKRAEKRADAAERKNQELESRLAALETSTKADKPEPKPDDFKSTAEFARAHSKWQEDQTAAAAANASTKDDTPAGDDAAETTSQSQHAVAEKDDLDDFVQRGTEKLGDVFQEALQNDPDDPHPISQVMGEFLFDSDVGPEIFVYLTENHDEAAKIFKAKAPAAMKSLQALEKRAQDGKLIETGKVTPETTGDDKDDDKGGEGDSTAGGEFVTNASPPPESHRESGTPAAAADPENETMDEYKARRDREELQKRGIYTR